MFRRSSEIARPRNTEIENKNVRQETQKWSDGAVRM